MPVHVHVRRAVPVHLAAAAASDVRRGCGLIHSLAMYTSYTRTALCLLYTHRQHWVVSIHNHHATL